VPVVGKCPRLGGTACRGPCYQGRQHAVPPPWRGRSEFSLLGGEGKGEGGLLPRLNMDGLGTGSFRRFPSGMALLWP